MEILKRSEAFKRAVSAFGPWNTWSRANHLAYGLIRGVPYSSMERCTNDDPHVWAFWFAKCLRMLGAWPLADEAERQKYPTKEEIEEVKSLITWVRKPIRVKKSRAETACEASEVA